MIAQAKRAERGALVLIIQHGMDGIDSVCKSLKGQYACQAVGTLSEARRWISLTERIIGAVLDVQLPDGSGFDLISALRQKNPTMPLLFLSSLYDSQTINRAHLESISLVARDSCDQNLKLFAMQIASALACPDDSIEQVLAEFVFEKSLSTRESQILKVAVQGIPRAHIARRLGTSENTIKSQIRSLLEKAQKPNLSEVVWQVHSRTKAN